MPVSEYVRVAEMVSVEECVRLGWEVTVTMWEMVRVGVWVGEREVVKDS